jgi:phosphatidylinositol alpha-mannosyltransferase
VAAALGELDVQVSIIAPRIGPRQAREWISPNVELVRLGGAHGVSLSGTRFEASLALGDERRRLQALMRRGGFDVVHYHALWTPFLPLQAFACSPSPKVATFHDTPPDGAGGALAKSVLAGLSRWLLPRLDAAIAVSEAPRAHLRPAPGQSVWLEPPCTDLTRFFKAPAPARASDGPPTILFVGRLEPRKGVGLLLEAFRRLSEDGVAARLRIAGSGAEEPALRQYVAEHGLETVEFLGRFDDADAPALFADCDIVCAPSPYGESFGIVIAEAMASGKPVVAAANRGYRTLLIGPGAQLLAPAGDVEGLHHRLKAAVLDPALRARLGAWGRAEAERYDCRRLAPRLLDIYQHAITAHAKAGRSAPRWSPEPQPDLGV